MLLKNVLMAQVGLSALLICSDAYAMDEADDFTTPVSNYSRRAKAAGPSEVNKESYAAVSQRLWGVLENSCKENDNNDLGNAKAVFHLLTTHLAEKQKTDELRGLLLNVRKEEIDIRVRLFNEEQASEGTGETSK